MSITLRKYDVTNDFNRVSEFLDRHYLPSNRDGNFPQPAWEYIHGHPYLDEKSLDKFGVWEDSGNIVGIVHYEHARGEAFFEVHPGYTSLRPTMLDYAEKNLYGESAEGRRSVRVWVNDFDKDVTELVRSRGYQMDDIPVRPMSQLKISLTFLPDTPLPAGFRLRSLAEDNDLEKLDRVLYRGFGHGDGPPPADRQVRLKARRKQQSVPGYRKDLNIIVVAPDGRFTAYSGTWIGTGNKYAYIEPVCTDPDYRRRGLGKAAVLEGVRRCVELGARVAYVASVQPFYLSMGFKKIFTCQGWIKYLDTD